MDKIKVHYQGGKSRYGTYAVDFMLAEIDGIELYAEKINPSWNAERECFDDETATYDDLRCEILSQARDQGINANRLEFWFDDVLYNSSQLAGYLGISREAIRKKLNSGKLQRDCSLADGQPLFTHQTAQRLKQERSHE